jgi:hypothetical protein
MLSGCLSIRYGTPIITSGLESLKLGESSRADALLALGQPRGEGVVRVNQVPEPRVIVFYEYIRLVDGKAELEILLVFEHRGRYDGHLWFGSTGRYEREGGLPVISPPEKIVSGRFPDIAPIEKRFHRGSTSREEVVRVLGDPVGTGSALLPPDHRRSEVLYYEDIEAGPVKQVEDEYVLDTSQRILLVMIADGRYDGFMWFTSVGVAKGKTE